MKNFKITEFDDLIESGKTCLVTNKITIDGMKVGFMYREEPDDEDDSGWRFLSGTEDDEYMDDPENMMMVDLNVVANYDKAILPILKKPVGSEWERIEGTNRWQVLEG
ncbi:MAG: DUF2185 domain-containing protein [Cytophagaceae bacterium]|nr:DUF2185 domain-containing protein [Cytophagaceae bacterium]MBK9933581.1 DUF2185 domain-containing protein [Cytophagaceae bacterium]MBL0302706.1 DUF2185 domain-containing protein [Cytophagaceae bacterium]MBL0325529.1 DUF2185 domain-containing protein [Cytophagaceae bacterium]